MANAGNDNIADVLIGYFYAFVNLGSLNHIKESFLHLFYPRLCEGCCKPLLQAEEVLCISCSLELPETGYHDMPENETALRFSGRIPYAHATSFAWFTTDGLLQHLIHGLKYRNKQETGRYLGTKFGQALQSTAWVSSVDLIIPVPLHKAKEAKRGYNQSQLIAEGMSSVLGIPAVSDILLRVRDTESQTKKTRAERVNNMAAAFTLGGKERLKDRHVLLCDDVLTTGATLEACALALMQEGSIKISIATVGIAVS